jgi:hypothetical protein
LVAGVTLDLTKLSPGEKIMSSAAGLYFVWSFFPVWYAVDLPGGSGRISGWHGLTTVASVVAVLAVAWIALRAVGFTVRSEVRPVVVDLSLALIGLGFTAAAFIVPPEFFGISWGLVIGLGLAIGWVYGAYLRFVEPTMGPATSS